ncbi:MAG: ABC transporter substrate-binding protein [Vulcanimicrobiaceae bacterium]
MLSRKTFVAGVAAGAALAPATSARAAGPIRIGYSAWPGWFPWKVAEAKGLFAKNGVDVQMVWFDDYTASISALSAGKLDGNCETTNDAISAQAGGAPRTIVLTNDNSSGNDQVIAKTEVGNVKSLAGRNVAVEFGLVDHFLLLLALERAGVPQSAVHIKPLPTDKAAAAFAGGKVDACAVFAPFTTTALKTNLGHAIASSKDFPGAIPDHLVLAPAFVSAHPGDVAKIVKTWFDTLDYIAANRAEAVAIMAKRAGVTTKDYASYDGGTHIFTLAENLEAFAPGSTLKHLSRSGTMMATFLVKAGLTKKTVAVQPMLDASFVKAYAAQHGKA